MHFHTTDMAISIAFFLGILHALEPGHGKTAIFAYMLGGPRKLHQPILMGFSMALTHTLSIFGIALVTHLLAHLISSNDTNHTTIVLHCLEWISAVTILAIGSFLLWRAIQNNPVHVCGRGCGRHHHRSSSLQTPPISKLRQGSQFKSLSDQTASTDLRVSAMLGVGAGLMPCPTALAAYFTGVASGHIEEALWGTLIYGAGIALALSAIGIIIFFSHTRIKSAASRVDIRSTTESLALQERQRSVSPRLLSLAKKKPKARCSIAPIKVGMALSEHPISSKTVSSEDRSRNTDLNTAPWLNVWFPFR